MACDRLAAIVGSVEILTMASVASAIWTTVSVMVSFGRELVIVDKGEEEGKAGNK